MFLRNRAAVLLGSSSLALLIVWGKIASDIYRLPGPDSALLLFQFMVVISLTEASTTTLTFDYAMKRLEDKNDSFSEVEKKKVTEWVGGQLLSIGKLTIAASGLSLGLIVLGSIVSVSVNLLAFSGILALASIVAIFILLTYRREPEEGRRSAN